MDDELPIGRMTTLVGANIRRWRQVRGLTLEAMSVALEQNHGHHLSPLTLSRLERGERRIDVEDVVAIALVLWLDPVELFDDLPDAPLDAQIDARVAEVLRRVTDASAAQAAARQASGVLAGHLDELARWVARQDDDVAVAVRQKLLTENIDLALRYDELVDDERYHEAHAHLGSALRENPDEVEGTH